MDSASPINTDVLRHIIRTPRMFAVFSCCSRGLAKYLAENIEKYGSISDLVVSQYPTHRHSKVCIKIFGQVWRIATHNGVWSLITPAGSWTNGGNKQSQLLVGGTYVAGSGEDPRTIIKDMFGRKAGRVLVAINAAITTRIFAKIQCTVEFILPDIRVVHTSTGEHRISMGQRGVSPFMVRSGRQKTYILSTICNEYTHMSNTQLCMIGPTIYAIPDNVVELVAAAFDVYRVIPF